MTTLATTDISPYEFQYQGRTIILIDTPGINQPFVSEAEVLTRLLRWVREIYGPEGKLSGIIYLHDLNAVRMQGSVLRGLNGLAELCGDESFDKLVLGTTFWDRLAAEEIGRDKELELQRPGGFWHHLVQRGARVKRVPGTREEAREILFDMRRQGAMLIAQEGRLLLEGVAAQANAEPEELKIAHARELQEREDRRRSQVEQMENRSIRVNQARLAELEAERRQRDKDHRLNIAIEDWEGRKTLLGLEWELNRKKSIAAFEARLQMMALHGTELVGQTSAPLFVSKEKWVEQRLGPRPNPCTVQ